MSTKIVRETNGKMEVSLASSVGLQTAETHGVIRASAPGRAGIIGNPTDMYGGSVISCSIEERAWCELVPSDHLVIRVGSDTYEVEDTRALIPDGGKFDLAKAALRAFELYPDCTNFELTLGTEVPEQAGLGGSTALLAAVVGCLMAWLGVKRERHELAESIRRIEVGEMGILCGYQDHYMAVFGGLNYMDFRGKERMTQAEDEPFATVEQLTIDEQPPMVLAHTGIVRCSGSVHEGPRQRWERGEKQFVEGYDRIAWLCRLGKRALLANDWETLGNLMNENHAIVRQLGGSHEAVERLIDAALGSGAWGAKLAGAGNGGTIIAVTPDIENTAEALMVAGAARILRLMPSRGLIVEREDLR